MAFNSIGDLASSLLLSQANAKVKRDLVQYSTELTSGLTTDVRGRLRNDISKQIDWEHGISTNQVLEKTVTEALTKVRAKQVALQAISETSIGFANDVSVTVSSNSKTALNALSKEATNKLSQMLSHLNTQALGQSLFSGSASNSPAAASVDNVLTSVKTYLGSVSAASGVVQGVQDWMNDPVSGYKNVAYLGSSEPASPIRLSNDRAIEESLKADDPSLMAMVEGLILAALSADDGLLNTQNQRVSLLQKASNSIRLADEKLIDLQANLGFVEAELSKTKVESSAAIHSYEKLRNDTLGIDEFEVATKLQETELQLEKIYALTARSARMSLLEYLR